MKIKLYRPWNNVIFIKPECWIGETNQQGVYSVQIRIDEKGQSQQIAYFIKEKVDVIVINPVKSDSPDIIRASLNAAKSWHPHWSW